MMSPYRDPPFPSMSAPKLAIATICGRSRPARVSSHGRRRQGLRRSPVKLLPQGLDPALCLDQRLAERLASAPLADEVDEVREAALFPAEFRLLRANRLRNVR